ncbi:aminopeptidase P family protein [uncultured Prevotella sp.]|uniref:aminopeptidase P family protein n=1 Tax=uncultured Prevotella sp. TaxID=159272 RepID=UPI00262E9195|nr:aminopeptidase P family protein [uncultured Prevotella sp.]
MTNTIIEKRLAALREVMKQESIDAFIFPSTDPHNGEYVPEHWEGRKWISGFNGSAGTAVVTMNAAALWTDSRYFLAAAEQLEGTEFKLMKERVEGTPSIIKWLGMKLSFVSSPVVGVDGMVNSEASVAELVAGLRAEGGITVRTNFDPLERIWTDRPPVPQNKISIHPLEYAGETCASKLERIRARLKDMHAYGMLAAALDDIAWTLNLRGSDVHCNPVFVSYLLITPRHATLFVDSAKLTDDVREYLKGEGVDTANYNKVKDALAAYSEYNILLDPCEINHTLFSAVRCEKVTQPSPIPYMKAVKNSAEIEGFRRAMLRDGVALVKFLRWLKPAVEAGGETEISVDRKLTSLRAEQKLFKDISFDTIAAYQEHGAVVHYEATPETDVPLRPEGLILIDSGAQYLDGTTDITRTIALGDVTEEQKLVYTLVLKGHIQLELCKFPRGASGTQLDALARKDMWRYGFNYMHGTGHGVGSYLNVHEGPHQIRMEYKPAPLVEGMTVTDEPGIYLAGRFGVRIENTLLIVPYRDTEFGSFLGFESLTLCPIDLAPVKKEMLLPEEKEWLNAYHRTVYDRLSPHLEDEDREWLASACAEI